MWPSALLHQGFTDLVTTSFILSVPKVRPQWATDQVRAVRNTFKTKQVIRRRAVWRVGVFPVLKGLKLTRKHTHTQAARASVLSVRALSCLPATHRRDPSAVNVLRVDLTAITCRLHVRGGRGVLLWARCKCVHTFLHKLWVCGCVCVSCSWEYMHFCNIVHISKHPVKALEPVLHRSRGQTKLRCVLRHG